MNILINGAGFVNKGAEAMTRTVQIELTKRLGNVKLLLWRTKDCDRIIAKECGYTPIVLPFDNRESPWFRARGRRIMSVLWSVIELCKARRIKKATTIVNSHDFFTRACENYLGQMVDDFDVMIDISGLAYLDSKRLTGFHRVQPIVNNCRRYNKPIVFMPQLWGSFEMPKSKKKISELLNNSKTFYYSRDKTSCRHLEKALGKQKATIALYPDIVFCFEGEDLGTGRHILKEMGCSLKRPIVGVSPNMRVFERMAGKGLENEYLKIMVKIINDCIENYDIDIVLQANEIYEFGTRKDDRYLCNLIAKSVNKADRCFMTMENLTAESTKAIIGNFDFLIGSRFHSLVFALSQGVPAMSISWSHKYHGLFSVFGMENYVHECENIDLESLMSTFDIGWRERFNNSQVINEKVKELQIKIGNLFDEVATVIQNEKQ